ncbi:MAG: hypothetical protein JO023_12535 [Chloroflexi bacterium]|nr:hypothetical protein [Chloroflexota bacterium]
MAEASQGDRVICQQCGARAWLTPDADRHCTECGGTFAPMGPLASIVDRWFAPPPQRTAIFYPRHRKLLETMWTADDRGRETYEALQLERVSYDQFVRRATDLVERGLSEGWIVAQIPRAPTEDDTAYAIHFVDPDRWADELTALFLPAAAR